MYKKKLIIFLQCFQTGCVKTAKFSGVAFIVSVMAWRVKKDTSLQICSMN